MKNKFEKQNKIQVMKKKAKQKLDLIEQRWFK